MPVSHAKVGNVTYTVSLFGAGYRAVWSVDGTEWYNDVPNGTGRRDASQAERASRAFHKKTFGEWPKSAKFIHI